MLQHINTYDKLIISALTNGLPEQFYKEDQNKGLLEYLPDNRDCKPHTPYENGFHGPVYLIVGPENSSAAFSFADRAKSLKLATLVGQPTGGNKRGFNGGSYLFMTLPNSQIEFDIPVFAYFPATEQKDEGVQPDVITSSDISDIADGVDRERRAIDELISKKNR